MTDAAWVEDLIDEEWGTGSLGTSLDKPNSLKTEGTDDRRSRSIQADDPYIFFKDGGDPVVEPRSVGYREEYIESFVSIDIETPQGRKHLKGEIDETYGGLAGEVKRIMDKYRNGVHSAAPVPDPGYDIIIFDNFSDEVGNRGADRWGGVWTAIFITFAAEIQQDPVRPQP